jgi:hypothetical protein
MTVSTFTTAGQVAGMPDGAAMLTAWAQTATSAAQLVGPLVDTAFVPDHFRPRIDPRATDEEKAAARQVAVASATAAVLYGAEIGLSPMQALQGVLVIKGKVGMYAATMVALVQAAGHDVWTEDSTDARVIVCGRRAGQSAVERQVWDIERARKAGYLSNEKYKTDPQAMLWARAASVVCRRIAQDVLKGITSSTEEILDDEQRSLPRPVTRTVQRAPARAELGAAPVPGAAAQQPAVAPSGPPLPGEDDQPNPPAAGQAEGSEAKIDAKQWRQINEVFVTLGVTGPGQNEKRMSVLEALVFRPIGKGSDLMADEAVMVLDTLRADGRNVIAEVLNGGPASAQPAEPQQSHEWSPPLPGEGDELAADVDDVDPTIEGGFSE